MGGSRAPTPSRSRVAACAMDRALPDADREIRRHPRATQSAGSSRAGCKLARNSRWHVRRHGRHLRVGLVVSPVGPTRAARVLNAGVAEIGPRLLAARDRVLTDGALAGYWS